LFWNIAFMFDPFEFVHEYITVLVLAMSLLLSSSPDAPMVAPPPRKPFLHGCWPARAPIATTDCGEGLAGDFAGCADSSASGRSSRAPLLTSSRHVGQIFESRGIVAEQNGSPGRNMREVRPAVTALDGGVPEYFRRSMARRQRMSAREL
jgi:hypothetical protein